MEGKASGTSIGWCKDWAGAIRGKSNEKGTERTVSTPRFNFAFFKPIPPNSLEAHHLFQAGCDQVMVLR
jgi:hypothetical protein